MDIKERLNLIRNGKLDKEKFFPTDDEFEEYISKKDLDVQEYMYKSVELGYINGIKNAVENGADVNKWGGIMSDTPLIYAVEQNNLELIKYFINHGAKVNIGNYNNTTPLMTACMYFEEYYTSEQKTLKIVKFLIEKCNAEINKKNEDGNTALSFAVDNEYSLIINYLFKHGADINTIDKHGNTLLMNAVSNESLSMVKLLIETYNVDIFVKNKEGLRAFDIEPSTLYNSPFSDIHKIKEYLDKKVKEIKKTTD